MNPCRGSLGSSSVQSGRSASAIAPAAASLVRLSLFCFDSFPGCDRGGVNAIQIDAFTCHRSPFSLPLLFDALVELVGAGDKTPYFFAQVKSTRLGYNKNKRLRVEVPKDNVLQMIVYPAPTYVIGIDEKQEKAYIVAVVTGMDKKISSLSTTHPLNGATLKLLWDEVREYWKDKDMEQKHSAFTN